MQVAVKLLLRVLATGWSKSLSTSWGCS